MESLIYYLHRGDFKPFYIGETRRKNARLSTHKKTYGNEVGMVVISKVKDWRRWEKYYIKKYKDLGFDLLNKNCGGGGVEKGTPKPKNFGEALSKQRKGNWVIPQHQIEAGIKAKNKKVLQYSLDGKLVNEFKSATLAAKHIGSHRVNMYNHLNRKPMCNTIKGFIFKYKDPTNG